ncbi:hypothetical protein GCM10022233_23520 [Streptomyces shaanxiensis]|uniref:Uncharacterized protein n=1 Tax=Streptomyces shaanxiensis TaxID=653357 RepID=A0ABP7USY6_9ACTN
MRLRQSNYDPASAIRLCRLKVLSLESLGLLQAIAGLTSGGTASGVGPVGSVLPAIPRTTWHGTSSSVVALQDQAQRSCGT